MRVLAVAICVVFSSLNVYAENWPQWRGPSLNGISTEKNLPVQWTTTENIAWKLPMPELSGSTPIIWGDRIFLNVAEKGSLFLWAVDRTKGEPSGSGISAMATTASASRTCRRRRRLPTGPQCG